jgi:hypothetical protein
MPEPGFYSRFVVVSHAKVLSSVHKHYINKEVLLASSKRQGIKYTNNLFQASKLTQIFKKPWCGVGVSEDHLPPVSCNGWDE